MTRFFLFLCLTSFGFAGQPANTIPKATFDFALDDLMGVKSDGKNRNYPGTNFSDAGKLTQGTLGVSVLPSNLQKLNTNNAVTLTNIPVTSLNLATSKLVGRTTASTGPGEAISVGTGLALSGGTLSATGEGGAATNVIHVAGSTSIDVATNDLLRTLTLDLSQTNQWRADAALAAQVATNKLDTDLRLALAPIGIGLTNNDTRALNLTNSANQFSGNFTNQGGTASQFVTHDANKKLIGTVDAVGLTNVQSTNIVINLKAAFSTNFTCTRLFSAYVLSGTNQLLTLENGTNGVPSGWVQAFVLDGTAYATAIVTNANGVQNVLATGALSQTITNGQSLVVMWTGTSWR